MKRTAGTTVTRATPSKCWGIPILLTQTTKGGPPFFLAGIFSVS